MNHLFTYRLALLGLLVSSCLMGFSQSPTYLTANVDLTAPTETALSPKPFFFSISQVINAFNKGRRAEEVQLGLTPNSLGNLTLPTNYTTVSIEQRALYIINAERQARAGLTYPVYSGTAIIGTTGPVMGLPLEGVELNLSAIAQSHANDMASHNSLSHVGSDGRDPFCRIAQSPTFGPASSSCPPTLQGLVGGCEDFVAYSENIYSFCWYMAVSPTYVVEQALFAWIYRDGPTWGHRKAVLLQDADVYGASATGYGYDNNYGSSSSEGFLGIGIQAVQPGYCGAPYGHFVVMNIVDPKPGCTYSVQASPMPVNWISFRGRINLNTIDLSWQTATEQHNSYFDIERSTDARQFTSIGRVAGHGTTDQPSDYTYTDETPLPGTAYYRLKQVDTDSTFTYSNIIALTRRSADNILLVYPNPSSETFTIVSSSGYDTINLTDASGRAVAYTLEGNQLHFGSCPPGVYTITAGQASGQRVSQKIIKQP